MFGCPQEFLSTDRSFEYSQLLILSRNKIFCYTLLTKGLIHYNVGDRPPDKTTE